MMRRRDPSPGAEPTATNPLYEYRPSDSFSSIICRPSAIGLANWPTTWVGIQNFFFF